MWVMKKLSRVWHTHTLAHTHFTREVERVQNPKMHNVSQIQCPFWCVCVYSLKIPCGAIVTKSAGSNNTHSLKYAWSFKYRHVHQKKWKETFIDHKFILFAFTTSQAETHTSFLLKIGRLRDFSNPFSLTKAASFSHHNPKSNIRSKSN